MDSRITMVRLAVDDIEISSQFYEGLGWSRHKLSMATIAAFQAGPMVFCLVRKDILKNELRLPSDPNGGAGRITLDHHVSSNAEISDILDNVEDLGGKIICRDEDGPMGANHYGCFEDPDGHIWRVVCSNIVTLNPDGTVSLPD